MESPCRKMESVALYNSKTRQKVKRAAPGGEGYVMTIFPRLPSRTISPDLTVLSKAARRVIRIHSSTTLTKSIRQTGQKTFWISSPADGDISWKNIFRSFWTKAVRKSAAASYPTIGRRSPTYCWRTSPANGRTGQTRMAASPVIRHTGRLPT